MIEDNSKKYFTEDEWSAYQIIKEFRDNDVWVYEKNQRFYIDLISSDLIRAFSDLSNKRYNKFSFEMGSATIDAFKNTTNANKNHFSGWFVGIWGQYSNSSEIDEQVTMRSLKKLRDDLNFVMQEYKGKSMNIAAMHTQNFIKKLDAIIKPENEDSQTGQVILWSKKNIPKSSADLYKSLLAEFKPEWNVEITIEDYNLYKLGFVEEIPCSISLNVSREDIYELQEEILDMEVTIYSYEDILYKNPMDMTDDEKKTYKKLKELEKRYNKFEPLENLFSYYLLINGKEI